MGKHSKGRSEFGTRFTFGGAVAQNVEGVVLRDYEREIEVPFAYISDFALMAQVILSAAHNLQGGAEVLLGQDELDKDLICLLEGENRPYFGHPLGTFTLVNNQELPISLPSDID